MRPLTLVAVVGAVLIVSACGAEDQPTAAAPAATASPPGSAQAASRPTATAETTHASTGRRKRRGTVIRTAGSRFGPVLFDGRGQAIYLFDKETSAKPNCYGACADAWPPVLTKRRPVARGAVKRSLLGTTRRSDGTRQVTYDGHPLYYYAHEGRNEVRCHNVPGFGGLWFAVEPGGGAAPV